MSVKEITREQIGQVTGFTPDELKRMLEFTHALAAAIYELHTAGAEWKGNGILILDGSDKKGQVAMVVANNPANNNSANAAIKAIEAYARSLDNSPYPDGMYL